MSDTPTVILSLTAENVKRIKAIRVEPGGRAVVRVGGRNGQGKTSLLDCIAMAIGGASAVPSTPIRRGATKAQIILETSELTVTRRFSEKGGTTLEVKNRDGQKFSGPQGVLDRLTSNLAFDPLEFINADKKAQFLQLQNLLGIDTVAIDTQRKTEFERRTNKNREIRELKAVIESMPITGPARVEVKELLDEMTRAQQINAGVDELEREVENAGGAEKRAFQESETASRTVGDLREKLRAAEIQETEARHRYHEAQKASALSAERLDRAERVDLAPIRERITNAEATNQQAAAVEARRRKILDLGAFESEADMMTAEIQRLDTLRATMLTDCKMPVEGIGFEADGITLNGLPLDQASGAERLRLGLAVACAMNPKMRVMLIRDGSLLDDESMGLVEEMALAHGAQVWIERVGNDNGRCAVVIEDGEAVEAGTDAGPVPAPVVAETVQATPPPAAPEMDY